ncbi:MAG: Nif3-like dinuclear metal center hexameric protein [Bacteroidales bacterium]|nr:Nif3-like dinuclear metal center hexameric protein [Bacteroidales bacterium]
MKISEVTAVLEELAPLGLQESYDNAGLLIGNPSWEVKAVLCTIDVTAEVLREAQKLGCNLIVAHHPLIFGNLKSLTGKTEEERIIIEAIRSDIAIYASHTNLDNIREGVNAMICQKLGLVNARILAPARGQLSKLVSFVPTDHANAVREAIFNAGAGHIGNYDSCSFSLAGEGTFRGGESANPFVGKKGELHREPEVRIETIVPNTLINQVVQAMLQSHPYEEVAYDIYPLENRYEGVGAGMIGEFPHPMQQDDFMRHLKNSFKTRVIRYAGPEKGSYRKVAVCGGSGSFLIKQARAARADVFITGDLKYHQFFEAGNELLICDIGHYESEQFTKEIFYSAITKKFSTFAVHLTSIVTNPIKYFE